MRPQHDQPAALDAVEVAAALRIPERTARRWLAYWFDLGVRGVSREPSRGRYGHRYLASRDLPARWRRGELPTPRAAAA